MDNEATINVDEIYCKGRRQTDGSYKIIFYTGEYEFDNYQALERLVATNPDKFFKVRVQVIDKQESSPETDSEGRTTQDKYENQQQEGENASMHKLWSVIGNVAKWEEKETEEVEKRIKADLGIESFTELSDKEMENLIETQQAKVRNYFQGSLPGEETSNPQASD